jgi:oxygen-independent coproporphyrinogen-3 oxidase
MLNALRLKQGFNIELFEQHTGLTRRSIADACQQAIDKGLLIQTDNHLMPTDLGYGFLNDLICLFSD